MPHPHPIPPGTGDSDNRTGPGLHERLHLDLHAGVHLDQGTRTDPTQPLTAQDTAAVSDPARDATDPSSRVLSWGRDTRRRRYPVTDPVLRVQSHLTNRDHTLLGWLAKHAVLTSFQIADALFPSRDFAQERLRTLTRIGVLDRFRPQRPDGGSYPYHYILAQLGAKVVAAQRGDDLPAGDRSCLTSIRPSRSQSWSTSDFDRTPNWTRGIGSQPRSTALSATATMLRQTLMSGSSLG